ncbi:MAG: efflux RND transporter periplasmic adaptor subunit [Planctomycetota bacterium]
MLGAVGAAGYGLYAWKHRQIAVAATAAAQQHEPAEVIKARPAAQRQYARTTTAVGTVRALRSITLSNELAGTVRDVALRTGEVVTEGALLVELDVSVEQAELAALEADARLADSMLARMEQALESQGASAADVDRARAERDMAAANVARVQALIERKRLRAPFPARVGMVDLHPGQYLNPGTAITTLQGIDDAVHIDFAVTQETAAVLALGREIDVSFAGRQSQAKIVAIDARVDSTTRNTWLRALLAGPPTPPPGASVRVSVPVEAPRDVVVTDVTALRRGPSGDLVFVIGTGPDGKPRASARRVVAGATLGDEVVIREGLEAGELVATDGSFKLREGALVQVAANESKPN